MSKDLFCAMIRPSSTNKRMEIGIFRFLRRFSRIYKNGVRYKADKMGKRADPWPTLTLISKLEECKSFQI